MGSELAGREQIVLRTLPDHRAHHLGTRFARLIKENLAVIAVELPGFWPVRWPIGHQLEFRCRG